MVCSLARCVRISQSKKKMKEWDADTERERERERAMARARERERCSGIRSNENEIHKWEYTVTDFGKIEWDNDIGVSGRAIEKR